MLLGSSVPFFPFKWQQLYILNYGARFMPNNKFEARFDLQKCVILCTYVLKMTRNELFECKVLSFRRKMIVVEFIFKPFSNWKDFDMYQLVVVKNRRIVKYFDYVCINSPCHSRRSFDFELSIGIMQLGYDDFCRELVVGIDFGFVLERHDLRINIKVKLK